MLVTSQSGQLWVVRNGTRELVSGAPFTMLPFIAQFLARPRWLAAFLRDGGLMRFANVVLEEGPMPYADVNGASLWYEEEGEGPAVLFVHGGLGDLRLWEPEASLTAV